MDARTQDGQLIFLAAREAPRGEDISIWRLLRGYRADPLARWTRLREQGPVVRYRFGLADAYFISHPEGVRRVLQENVGNYTKEHASYRMLRRLTGEGLITSEGSFWLRQRRLAQPAFHRERVARMGDQMTAAAAATAKRWSQRLASGEQLSMVQEMSGLTLRIVLEALFGAELPDRVSTVSSAWEVLNRQTVERYNNRRLLPPILPTQYDREFRRARSSMLRVVDELIAHERAKGGGGAQSLLAMLMQANDEETGEQMTDSQLRDEVATMLLAGHETTAVALSWTWGLLDQHPAARQRLTEELERVLAGRLPAADDLPRLPYTSAVIQEALRLYPPVYGLFRSVKRDDVLCGYRIHAGGVVVMAPVALHRHPAHWTAPDAFLPERWLDAEETKRRPRFAFMPFSGGPRQCIGNGFALLEAVLILATLAQRFAPRLARGYQLEPEYLVTLRPAAGLPMVLAAAEGSHDARPLCPAAGSGGTAAALRTPAT